MTADRSQNANPLIHSSQGSCIVLGIIQRNNLLEIKYVDEDRAYESEEE
jgi:hypothetical protein